MKDRISTYPGRVKLTPVAGQENVYDLVRMDEPTVTGTPLNKASLLTDETAALYGKTLDPVPDDILAELGRYKMHWWQTQGASWQEVQESVAGRGTLYLTGGWSGAAANTLYYSDAISIDQSTGEVSLASPTALKLTYNTSNTDDIATALAGKYVTGFLTDITWAGGQGALDPNIYLMKSSFSSDAITKRKIADSGDNYDYPYLYKVSTSASYVVGAVTAEFKVNPDAAVGYVQSLDESAYPHGGLQDGIEYTYLGVPLNNTIGVARIAVGNYAGTGPTGFSGDTDESSVTITVDFKPMFLLVAERDTFMDAYMTARPWGEYTYNTSASTGSRSTTWGANSVTLWASHGGYVPNRSGFEYFYVCYGI